MRTTFVVAVLFLFVGISGCGALHPVDSQCEAREVSSTQKKQCEKTAEIVRTENQPGYMSAGGGH